MKQRGVALLMGLVLLAALSLIAVTAANGMVLQRRVAANFALAQQARLLAAAAEAEARAWLESRADVERERGCVSGCLLPVAIRQAGELPLEPQYEAAAWWDRQSQRAGTHPQTGEALEPPLSAYGRAWWALEEVHFEPAEEETGEPVFAGIGYYRLIARGETNRPGGVAVTEAILARPWEGDIEPTAFPPDEPSSAFCGQFRAVVDCGSLAWRQLR